MPILDHAKPLDSPFFLILINPDGWCDLPQMPEGGPFITDSGYFVTLQNGTDITGQEIRDNIASWLSSGFPET